MSPRNRASGKEDHRSGGMMDAEPDAGQRP